MAKKIVIIGAVALGPKVACRLRRLDPTAQITLIDKDNLISYGGCGIPYYIGGDINDIEDLYKTSAHILRDKTFFADNKRIDVLTQVEATKIDRENKKVHVTYLEQGKIDELPYDTLVLATGATPSVPPFPGNGLSCVYTLSDLHQAEKIKTLMTQGKIGKAVVIGGGAIGIEISEALTDLWGIETTLLEMEDQLLPTLLGKCIGRVVKNQMEEKGVQILLDTKVHEVILDPETNSPIVITSKKNIETDIVILATGVRPNTHLAKEVGLAIGGSGGIAVDTRLRTSDPHIYAGGDCVEMRNILSGQNTLMPLGSLANRQGRIIATNIYGGNSHFEGTVGTFSIKVFDLGVCKAGLTVRQAKEIGYDPVYSVISQPDHAHFYPDTNMLYIALIADRKSRKVLGIEAASKNGDGVKGRVDAVAVLLKHSISVDEICSLETGYAPPYASAMDAVNNAGNCLDNILAGLNIPIDVYDFINEFQLGDSSVLDVRGAKEATPFIEKYGSRWINIPQNELHKRVQEIPTDIPLYLFCDTGPRSYEAQAFLISEGFTNTKNILGGFAMLKMVDPTFI